MPDSPARGEGERISLPDAALTLWREPWPGFAAKDLMRRIVAETDWQQRQVRVFGKLHRQPRLSAWHGDAGYRYSGIFHPPAPWTPTLSRLKQAVETVCEYPFNSVLLNYYRDGNDGMGMHSDDERELGARPAIASLSLGETRDLVFRHRRRRDLESFRLPLTSGSLLLMHGDTQRNWRHGIDKMKKPCGARLNLTFRYVTASA